jgi:glycerol 3-phosphatase-2
VFRGNVAIDGAGEAIDELRRRGRRVVFITNNSARTPAAVAKALGSLGISASPDEVVTSAQATVPLLRTLIGEGGAVFVIGEEGVRAALDEGGMKVLDGQPDRADAVVVGWDRGADYDALRMASVLVQRGARLVATNTDASYPAAGGELWPGAGALLAAVETTTGVKAAVAGKPRRHLFDVAVERVGTRQALVVGDRIETDVAGAAAAGLDSVLVLSGAARASELLDHDALPVAVLEDVTQLLEKRPDVRLRSTDTADDRAVRALIKDAGLTEPHPGLTQGGDGSSGTGGAGSAVVISGTGGLVGTAAAEIRGEDSYLHSVAVDEGHRGLGLGTLLVAAAVRPARQEGATSCFLITEEAAGFFTRLGFEPMERQALPRWILDISRECSVSAVAMHRSLA